MSETYRLLLGILVVWRLTHLLHGEDGPWQLIARARGVLARTLGGLLACFYCLSLWVAALPAWFLGTSLEDRAMLWLALSGGAILIERLTHREEVIAAPYFEGEEHELLRSRGENLGRDDARRRVIPRA